MKVSMMFLISTTYTMLTADMLILDFRLTGFAVVLQMNLSKKMYLLLGFHFRGGFCHFINTIKIINFWLRVKGFICEHHLSIEFTYLVTIQFS